MFGPEQVWPSNTGIILNIQSRSFSRIWELTSRSVASASLSPPDLFMLAPSIPSCKNASTWRIPSRESPPSFGAIVEFCWPPLPRNASQTWRNNTETHGLCQTPVVCSLVSDRGMRFDSEDPRCRVTVLTRPRESQRSHVYQQPLTLIDPMTITKPPVTLRRS